MEHASVAKFLFLKNRTHWRLGMKYCFTTLKLQVYFLSSFYFEKLISHKQCSHKNIIDDAAGSETNFET